jgi:hypothetical protein
VYAEFCFFKRRPREQEEEAQEEDMVKIIHSSKRDFGIFFETNPCGANSRQRTKEKRKERPRDKEQGKERLVCDLKKSWW